MTSDALTDSGIAYIISKDDEGIMIIEEIAILYR